ncbi:MAG: beta-galactosidase [Acidobacteria bacterium]|nr:beta-galactosidase [Acidobacteriota bacterium]
MIAPLAAPAGEPAPDPNRGLFAIWINDPKVADLPFIKGGQVVVQWQDLEPAEGHYDFSKLDEQLAAMRKLGRAATVQVNGNLHPAYLFGKVPYIGKKLSIQVRDRQGTLAYWHPNYVQAYTALIAAYGRHLKASPYRSSVLGVRLNFNALGTEHVEIPVADRDGAHWVVPSGVTFGPAWNPKMADDYRELIVNTFIRDFMPGIRVFARNNMFAENVRPEWDRALKSGRMGLFHTSSEMEPRPRSKQYDAFINYCRSGETTCYAESWADSWGRHGGKTDPRWCSPEQWNYWRMLVDLNCGVSFIAIYGADLSNVKNAEFRAAFDFAALYVGYHASPSLAPGAWVAMREGNTLKGDYSYLMKRVGDNMQPLEKAGPDDQRFGAWARLLANGKTAGFAMNGDFARSLEGHAATVNVIYLDRGRGSFATGCGGKKFTTVLADTGRWKTATFTLDRAAFQPAAGGAQITISADTDLTLHMVEVRR